MRLKFILKISTNVEMVFVLSIYFENLYFFCGASMARKIIREPFFSLKIKSSEKQRCVSKLFLSKSKILKRLNLRKFAKL